MNIIKTNTLDTLIARMQHADQQALIIFDINQVLIQEESAIFNISGRKHRQQLAQTDWSDLTTDQINLLWSIVLQTEPVRLVDERLPQIIASFRKRSINVMAHTSCRVGPYGQIPCAMDWSAQRLAKNNLSMHGSFIEHEMQKIALTADRGSDFTHFKSGILFNAQHIRFNKGEVLDAFLKHIGFKPSQIIFVDNQMENLEAVGSFAEKEAIPFTGIFYTAAEESFAPYNEELARFQFNYLKEHKIWLSDSLATAQCK